MNERILNYMKETFLLEFNKDVTEDSDLFKLGILNSYGYIRLMEFLESEFKIKFSEEEILSNVFVTFSSIVDHVSKKVENTSSSC